MFSSGFMKALKYKSHENHNVLLPEVLNIDDSTTERKAAILILSCLYPACVGHPVIVKAVQ